jgi:hypothetical protein
MKYRLTEYMAGTQVSVAVERRDAGERGTTYGYFLRRTPYFAALLGAPPVIAKVPVTTATGYLRVLYHVSHSVCRAPCSLPSVLFPQLSLISQLSWFAQKYM